MHPAQLALCSGRPARGATFLSHPALPSVPQLLSLGIAQRRGSHFRSSDVLPDVLSVCLGPATGTATTALQVERSHRASQEAALEAAHLAEERVLQQYRQVLQELESAHEAEQEGLVVRCGFKLRLCISLVRPGGSVGGCTASIGAPQVALMQLLDCLPARRCLRP